MSSETALPWQVEAGKDGSFVKRMIYAIGKYSTVLIRVGHESKEFTFLLYPLVVQSDYLRRRVETICGEEKDRSTVTIDLPDFSHGSGNIRLIQDFCCGVLDDNNISRENIVKLLATSDFLEMKFLKKRLWKYIEGNVLDSRESSLKVLATFDSTNLPGIDVDHSQKDCLFGRCQKIFLRPLEGEVFEGKPSVCYNVVDLLRAARRLPACVVERIYQSLIAEQCRFNAGFFILYFRRGGAKAGDYKFAQGCRLVVSYRRRVGGNSGSRPLANTFLPNSADLVRRIKDLKYLPSVYMRSLLILYLIKLLHPEAQFSTPGLKTTIHLSDVEVNFSSVLLVEAVELVTGSYARWIAPGLAEQIPGLEKLASWGLQQAAKSAHRHSLLVVLLLKFKFATLLAIVKHFRSFWSDPVSILPFVGVLDIALAKFLRRKLLTAKEIFLIYQELPNEARPSHGDELYDVCQTFMTDLSSQGSLEQEQSNKVSPADLVESCNEVLQVDELRSSHQEELTNLRSKLRSAINSNILVETERDSLSKGKQLAESERDALQDSNNDLRGERDGLRENNNDLRGERDGLRESNDNLHGVLHSVIKSNILVETERDSLIDGKRLAESERDTLRDDKGLIESERNELRHDLDEEKERTTCQICFDQQRDALSLPCMHFLYCFKCLQEHHDRQGKTCPACRGFASCVLKCNLSV